MAAGARCARAGTRRRRSLRAGYSGVPSTLQGAALRWSRDNRHRWLQGNRTRVRAHRRDEDPGARDREGRLTSGASEAERSFQVPGVGAEKKPRTPEGLVPTAPSAASSGALAPPSPLDAWRAPLARRAWSPDRPDPSVKGNTTHDPGRVPDAGRPGWRAVRPRTGYRALSVALRQPKLTDGRARRWHPRGGGGGTGGIDPKFIRTERSCDLFGGKARLGVSYLLRGPGRAVALFRSAGGGLFRGKHVSLFPPSALILVTFLSSACPWERHYGCLASRSGRDKLNFKGQGLHILSARQIPPPFTPVSGSHP